MWRFLIILLLFVFNSCNGRTVLSPKTNNQDVYELIEDKGANTVSFVNPKSVMPILREITYYHVVEKPFDAVIEQNTEVVDTSSEDETERPFTNAHGLEFIDTYAVNDTKTKTEENKDEDLIDYLLLEEVGDEKPEGSNVEVNHTTEAEEEAEIATTLAPEEEDEEEKETIVKVAKEVEAESSTSTDVPQEVEPAKDQLINETATPYHEQTTLPNTQEVPVDLTANTEKGSQNERNRQLFESPEILKERYMKMKNLIATIKPKETVLENVSEKIETVKSRRRRSTEENISKTPEAPKLAELNFNSLPEYIKRLYSSDNPSIIKPTPIKVTTEKSESMEVENYEEEIEQKLEDMFTAIKSDHSTHDGIQEIDINADGIVNMATDEIRTYGMNLTSDRGYVWNNLWSNPGMYYHVGELETVEEDRDKEQIVEPQLQHSKPEEQTSKPDEKPNTEEDEPKPNKEESEASLEDLSDIYVNLDKQKPKPKEMQPIVEEFPSIEGHHKPEKQDETEILEDEDKEKDPKSLKELLNNKKFWDWLSDWTSTYMELLVKQIGIIVKEEISKQMESNKSDPIKNKDEQGLNKDNCKIENLEETSKKGDQKTEDNSTADKEPNTSISPDNLENKDIEKEKTIFMDGKKIPLTSTSNFNQTSEHLSKKRHKEEQKDVKGTETKVLAQNIYGNSVGSSKVVNVYFFLTEDKKHFIDEVVKPLLNKEGNINNVNVTFENRVNIPDEDKKAEEESKTEEPKKDDTKKEDSKKDESKKEESKKDDLKKEDSKKEDSNTEDSKKEDSKKEDTKKEESEKEGTKKEESMKDDLKKEDSNKEDSKREDSKKEDLMKEDSKKENTKKEESKKEDTKKEESMKDDLKKEDSNKEDSKRENLMKGDSKKEYTKKEDTKIEQSKKEDFKKEESKKDDLKKEDSNKDDSKREDLMKEDLKKEDLMKEDSKKENSTKAESKKEDIPKTKPEKVIENETTISREPTTEKPLEDSKEENNKVTTFITEASTTTKPITKDVEENVINAEKNDRNKSSENKESSSIKDSNKAEEKDTKVSDTIDAEKTDSSNVEESKPRGDSDVKESKNELDMKIESEKRAYQSLFSKPSTKEKTKTKVQSPKQE